MDQLTISEDWIRKKLNITHDNLGNSIIILLFFKNINS
jgi:hypothetical protein